MRSDTAAAYFDHETTGYLVKAIQRGEAPPPTATRVRNGRREPVWAKAACDRFIENRHGLASESAAANDNGLSPTTNVEFV
jgi:hypothetical protein